MNTQPLATEETDDPQAGGASIAHARGLPNAHYLGDLWEAERDALLFGAWAGLCLEADVAAPGDALPVAFAGAPLLALRGRDGNVRVFQNVCRHRGMILVDAPRRIEGAIRCPYHSWCYDHDGALRATPHVGGPGMNRAEGIDRESLGLVAVPSGGMARRRLDQRRRPGGPVRGVDRWRRVALARHRRAVSRQGPLHPGGSVQLEACGRELLRKLPSALDPSRPERLFPPRGPLRDRGGRLLRSGHGCLHARLRLRRLARPRPAMAAGGGVPRALSERPARAASRPRLRDRA